MTGFGVIKPFPSPGYEVWDDRGDFYLDVCAILIWAEEEVKRYLPEKLCGWALDAFNYLQHEFWKSDQNYCSWTLQETLFFFALRLSKFPKVYEDVGVQKVKVYRK